jgi:5-(carboxyamino)imidazole ribonucleotide synthase
MTETLAQSVNLRGVLALELFVTNDGMLLANEIAPRTHNSGHWSIDACAVSQFENHVRAVCGLPVLPPNCHSDCEMINLIGADINHLERYKHNKNACIHLYGKHDVKPGRKMGHVTILKEKNNVCKG